MFNYGFDVFSCLKNNPTISMYLNSPFLSGGLKVQTASAALGDIFDVEVVMNFIHKEQLITLSEVILTPCDQTGRQGCPVSPPSFRGMDRPNTTFGICMYSWLVDKTKIDQL